WQIPHDRAEHPGARLRAFRRDLRDPRDRRRPAARPQTPCLSGDAVTPVRSIALALIGACIVAALATPAASATGDAAALAGTYRIDSWKDLESRGLFHFFYLDPSGRFYLAGEWKGSETSRFGGVWSVAGDRLQLSGTADVNTNQGHWTIPY